jgi:hypothetical protein
VATEYVVKRTGDFWQADVISDGKKVGELTKGDGLNFQVKVKDAKQGFLLDPRVDGKIRPFSMVAYEITNPDGKEKRMVLKILNNLFLHQGAMYALGNLPEGRTARDHVFGSRFISRMDNFPFKSLEDVDLATHARLKKHRGIKVGEMSGLGVSGHKVTLEPELQDIGIPLATSSYLIYSSG